MKFDTLQGYRYARDTLEGTPIREIPQIVRTLQALADRRPADYAEGIRKYIAEVLPK